MTRKIRNADTLAELVDLLGGNDAVAKCTGKTPNAVRVWRQRGHFPAHVISDVQTAMQAARIKAAPGVLEPRRYTRLSATDAECAIPYKVGEKAGPPMTGGPISLGAEGGLAPQKLGRRGKTTASAVEIGPASSEPEHT